MTGEKNGGGVSGGFLTPPPPVSTATTTTTTTTMSAPPPHVAAAAATTRAVRARCMRTPFDRRLGNTGQCDGPCARESNERTTGNYYY